MSAPAAKKVPLRACRFLLEEDAPLLLAAGDGEKKPTFEMVANSGKPILGHWYWGNLGIDLEGVKCKKRMPVLKDHDPDQRIGFTVANEVVAKTGMVVRGELLPSSVLAQQIRQESREGFPWQASVHLRPLKIERIQEGETAEVNGYTLVGPGHVFRKSECREVSFTALGADSETSASALSATSAGEFEAEFTENHMTTKTEPAAQPPAVPNLEAARAEASSAALTAERNRVAAILAAATPDQAALAQKLVADGTALAEALQQINADLRTRMTALQQRVAAAPPSDAPLSGGNNANPAPTQTPLDAAKALPEGEEKWAKLYELDPALRSEFTSSESFVAFMKGPKPR